MATANTRRDVSKTYCDLYNTPDIALEKLIKVVSFNDSIHVLEPCAGKGKISEFLTSEIGCKVTTNELETHGYETDFSLDFLKEDLPSSAYFDCIITNPPYKIAKEFILKGFKYSRHQYHFLRLSFLESKNRHEELFSKGHLKNIYLFVSRVSCSKGVTEEPQANAVAYAWYHFDKDFNGLPTLHWI